MIRSLNPVPLCYQLHRGAVPAKEIRISCPGLLTYSFLFLACNLMVKSRGFGVKPLPRIVLRKQLTLYTSGFSGCKIGIIMVRLQNCIKDATK